MNRLISILVNRDGVSEQEAVAILNECGEMVRDGYDPESVLHEELGLEPDYFFDLLEFI